MVIIQGFLGIGTKCYVITFGYSVISEFRRREKTSIHLFDVIMFGNYQKTEHGRKQWLDTAMKLKMLHEHST